MVTLLNKKPVTLIIMDGFGESGNKKGNAISAAKTPNLGRLFAASPRTRLKCSGLAVGLPEGQMGNSEVGHTNIGAGRVVYQDLTRISKDIEEGAFFRNSAFLAAAENCRANNSALHLMGLLSDGGVHSSNTHLYSLLKYFDNVPNIYIHCFLDGRDVPPQSGECYIEELESRLIGHNAKIATVTGRYYAMDRDNRFERVREAFDAIAYGEGKAADKSPAESVRDSYRQGVTDEFVKPVVCGGYQGVGENDSMVFFNFRPDRAREITRAFVDPGFSGFVRKGGFPKVFFVCMTEYDAGMPNVQVAYSSERLCDTLGEYLSRRSLTQLRIAETEKYAHVTFFFNGGEETVYPGEDRVLIPSPKVATYDLMPEMSAYPVTDEVIRRMDSGKYDVIILNFANCDMVGHTGDFGAAVRAVEVVDECVGRILTKTAEIGAVTLVTADHGNAECMISSDNETPFTAHTTSPVPFAAAGLACRLRDGGALSDIAPTILDIMGLEKPKAMTGTSLIVK